MAHFLKEPYMNMYFCDVNQPGDQTKFWTTKIHFDKHLLRTYMLSDPA